MSVRYDPLLAAALASEIRAKYAGEPIAALGTHGESRTVALAFADGTVLWVFLHPRAGQIVPGPRSPLAALLSDRATWKKAVRSGMIRTGDWEWRTFRSLRVVGVDAPADERLIRIGLGDGASIRYRILLDLPRNRRNVLLLERPSGGMDPERSAAGWRILLSLRTRPGATVGEIYRPPASERAGADEPLSLAGWKELMETAEADATDTHAAEADATDTHAAEADATDTDATEADAPDAAAPQPPTPRRRLLERVAYVSPLNVDYIVAGPAPGTPADTRTWKPVPEGGTPPARNRGAEPEAAAWGRYREVLESPGRWVLPRTWGRQPYVHPLGSPDAVRTESLLEGMARSAAEEQIEPPAESMASLAPVVPRDVGEVDAVASALRRKRTRLDRRLVALAAELEECKEPDRLREAGHLLLAHLREVPRGASRIELIDFSGSPRKIELDPALDAATNAERFYRRAARRERARERLPALMADVEREIDAVDAGLARLAETGVADEPLRTLAEMQRAEARPGAKARSGTEAPERLPYQRYRSVGGLEIRVGRSSRDNDALTFHHSAPDDIWLHARQVAGAHVILRWDRRDQNPPERDLADAAVLAALHSEARHSGVVAVGWTRRKYVRKPRKAAPGAVVPDRLKTIFVEPDPEAPRKLSP